MSLIDAEVDHEWMLLRRAFAQATRAVPERLREISGVWHLKGVWKHQGIGLVESTILILVRHDSTGKQSNVGKTILTIPQITTKMWYT